MTLEFDRILLAKFKIGTIQFLSVNSRNPGRFLSYEIHFLCFSPSTVFHCRFFLREFVSGIPSVRFTLTEFILFSLGNIYSWQACTFSSFFFVMSTREKGREYNNGTRNIQKCSRQSLI